MLVLRGGHAPLSAPVVPMLDPGQRAVEVVQVDSLGDEPGAPVPRRHRDPFVGDLGLAGAHRSASSLILCASAICRRSRSGDIGSSVMKTLMPWPRSASSTAAAMAAATGIVAP